MRLPADRLACLSAAIAIVLASAVPSWAAKPPRATIETDFGSQTIGASQYCWEIEDDKPVCADSPWIVAKSYLRVERGGSVRLSVEGDEEDPKALRLHVFEPLPDDYDPNEQTSGAKVLTKGFGSTLSAKWDVDLPPGKYVVAFFAGWNNKQDARWVFGINVIRPAATPLGTTAIPLLPLAAASALLLVFGALLRTFAGNADLRSIH